LIDDEIFDGSSLSSKISLVIEVYNEEDNCIGCIEVSSSNRETSDRVIVVISDRMSSGTIDGFFDGAKMVFVRGTAGVIYYANLSIFCFSFNSNELKI